MIHRVLSCLLVFLLLIIGIEEEDNLVTYQTQSKEDVAVCYLLAMKIIAKHPELRLQQIMSIAAHKAGWEEDDLFYCPNDVIIKGLNLLLQEVCPDDD